MAVNAITASKGTNGLWWNTGSVRKAGEGVLEQLSPVQPLPQHFWGRDLELMVAGWWLLCKDCHRVQELAPTAQPGTLTSAGVY